MWRFLRLMFDTILPRKERVVRVEMYTPDDLHIMPIEHEACGVSIAALMSYRTQAVDDCIRALKYDRAEHAVTILAEALSEYLQEEIASFKSFSTKPIVLIPVPLHKSRVRERGFNQVEVVLRSLPHHFQDGTLATVSDALVRTRATKQQTRLSRQERLKNVEGAFALVSPEKLRDAHVILVDDVTTTGATLANAALPLQDAGVRVTLIALARA